MKTKVLVGVLLFLIVVNLSTIGVFVYHLLRPAPTNVEPFPIGGDRPPGMMGGVSPMMMPPEVRERVHALMLKFHEDVSDLQARIFSLEDSTVAMLKNDPPPMNRVNENLRRLSELRLLINQRAIENLLQAKSFLTQDQQDVFFRAIMQARPQASHMGGGMGRGPMWGRQMHGEQGRIDTGKSH